MEITVTQRRENGLLDRTEVLFTIAHPDAGTPTRADIRKALVASLNAKDSVVILDWARSEFGKTSTRGYAKVYKSKERAMSLETPPILIRNGLMQPVAKKEVAKEAPATPPPRKAREPKPEAPKEAPREPAKEEKESKKEAASKPAAKEEAPKKEARPAAKEKEEKKEPSKKEEGTKEKKAAAKKEAK